MAIDSFDRPVFVDTFLFDVSEDANASSYIEGWKIQHFDSISIANGGAALTGTIRLQALVLRQSDETSDGNWMDVQSPPGTDITIAEDKIIAVTVQPWVAIRLFSDMDEASDRAFHVHGWRK